ncbi:MAG: glycosyltransferase [Candidatus Moraniibacteriota bacterium]
MKLIFIKIGKAFTAIQREGILAGGRRVLLAFFSLFRFVGKGQILFVIGGVGDSARYRAHHVSEELESKGFKCSITVQDNPLIPSYVDKFDVFIFHRVLFSPSVKKMIEKIKQQKKEIIFETDDLVYDPKYLEYMDYFKVMNPLEKKLYENGVGGEILADPYVKVATTSTTFLAEKLAGRGKKVFLVPNKLSNVDVQTANAVLEARRSTPKELNGISIGYFSGAPSHNKDFATVTDVLMQIMEKYSNVELFLAGPLDIESKLNKYGERIKKLAQVPRKEHFANVANVDINIAPLEIGNPFCESKSELKFFEAGIVKVPTLAAATQTFREAIEDGVDGFVANDTQEWFEKLEKLVLDKDLRKSMGEKAHEKVLARYSNENANNVQYYEYLKRHITHSI